ncbi:MAG: glycoside hydrolase family 5 protein, partial [Armatimonadetes bacterium]|nr:glycoside hydrolase family 5 protein [Armatimonadota bacterium]
MLFFSAGCAKAQEVYEIPQPEAPAGAPVVVAPAPFEKTVWRAGQNGVLKLSGPLAGYTGPLVVRDFGGRTVWSGSVAAGAATVALGVTNAGLYTLQAGDKTFSFSVVPAPKPRAAQVPGRMMIGLNTHFGPRDTPEEAFKILREVGIDSVRDEMGWGSMEKQKGVFNFIPRHVAYNAKLKQYGIPLHFSASYGNPLYPQVARYPSAEAAEPYARYVTEVLKRFGDNIIAVEVLNEPNKMGPVKDYAPVLRATTRAVKAAGFKQPVIATGGAGTGGGMVPDYARTVFGTGALSEGFSIHPYMAPFPPDTGYSPPGGAANLDAALTRAGNVVRDFNLQGVWITELGWSGMENGLVPTIENWVTPNSARTMNPEPKQAAFTARTLLVASKYPHLKAIYLYDFQDDGPIPSRREHRFGLVRQDLQPKMGFQAFAVAKDFLSDKVFVKTFQQPNSILRGNLYRDR